MNNGVGNASPHPPSVQNGQPWQDNLSPPVVSQPPSINMGMAKILPPHPTPMLSKCLP
ncbi:hypothetical protein LINPERHAP1_LOCUS30990 [Linum perenne]